MNHPTDSHHRAMAHIIRGDLATAQAELLGLLKRDPRDARAHFLTGRIASVRGDRDAELAAVRKAVALDPADSEFRAQLGRCHIGFGLIEQALSCARTAEEDAGASDLTLDTIATIYGHVGRYRRSADILQRAVKEGSRNPLVHFNLATSLKFCGDFVGAEAALDRAIALAPHFFKARAALSALRPATPERNQIAEYRATLTAISDPVARLHICHAAAQEYDAIGQYEEAFQLLREGKAGMVVGNHRDFGEDRALFDAIESGFAMPRPTRGHAGFRPIFVVGMPRSGTTVVDRILSNHADVQSVGESLEFPRLLQALSGQPSAHLVSSGAVAELANRDDLSDLGSAYIDSLQPLHEEGKRPLDKFHLNSPLAGFIARALPDARIVCVVRGAMDTIVGNYRQLFEYRSAVYRYALSTEHTAHFYVAFRRLADIWAQLFPANFRIVSYEQLVADPVRCARAMFDFCGLEWDERYLRIEDNMAPVSSASAVQVRRPLNTRSIGQWRRYEAHLDAAKRIITDAGLHL